MRDGNHRALILLQMGFQPLDTLGVQVVGGLVQQEHVRLLKEQAAQGHAAALTAGKFLDLLVRRRALQGIHGALQLGIYLPSVYMLDLLGEFSLALDETVHFIVIHGLHELEGNVVVFLQDIHHLLNTLLDHFQHGFFRVHLRFLLQVAHAVAGCPDHLSFVGLLYAGNDFEESGFTGAVEADNANFGPVKEAQVNVFEDDSVVVGENLAHPVHGKDDFFVGHGFRFCAR